MKLCRIYRLMKTNALLKSLDSYAKKTLLLSAIVSNLSFGWTPPSGSNAARSVSSIQIDVTIDATKLGGGNVIFAGVDYQSVQSVTLTFTCGTTGGGILQNGTVIGLELATNGILNCFITAITIANTTSTTIQYLITIPYLEYLGTGYYGQGTGSTTVGTNNNIPPNLLDGGTIGVPGGTYTLPNLSSVNLTLNKPFPISAIQQAIIDYYTQRAGEQSRIQQIAALMTKWEKLIETHMYFQSEYTSGGLYNPERILEAAAKGAERMQAIELLEKQREAEIAEIKENLNGNFFGPKY